ncbi:MerR family transcriptional regulator [Reinekea blandensis]|uniref:Predicted transcriptional regulator n=1 Tax=Reinekea blandensis MED297 TaxID=314283 RepID=A4BCN2_9GAMM|nr:MerR family transcriptional regulator [Reinekea blandensis]EAR09964.1 predicted transcriptional regulator [Reinekea sp. MED297] [Reinekea blandensis MED297]
MYIGEFCKQTQTTPKTIRYYESLGLLPPAKRLGSYRVYDDTYVETVRRIKQAQSYGFTLTELKKIFTGVDIRRGLPADVMRRAIQEKRRAIAAQITELQQTDAALVDLEGFLKQSGCAVDSDLKGKV